MNSEQYYGLPFQPAAVATMEFRNNNCISIRIFFDRNEILTALKKQQLQEDK